jgi:hypothetical protein
VVYCIRFWLRCAGELPLLLDAEAQFVLANFQKRLESLNLRPVHRSDEYVMAHERAASQHPFDGGSTKSMARCCWVREAVPAMTHPAGILSFSTDRPSDSLRQALDTLALHDVFVHQPKNTLGRARIRRQ